jgi:hypothetical protein
VSLEKIFAVSKIKKNTNTKKFLQRLLRWVNTRTLILLFRSWLPSAATFTINFRIIQIKPQKGKTGKVKTKKAEARKIPNLRLFVSARSIKRALKVYLPAIPVESGETPICHFP